MEYGDGIPLIAGGFLKGITEADIIAIIGGLGDNIEEVDRDLDGYDTDKIAEHKKPIKTEKKHSVLDGDTSESESESDDGYSSENLKGPVKELDKKAGGGNVLQILVSLIPNVFPKSYM